VAMLSTQYPDTHGKEAKRMPKGKDKVHKVMSEYKRGELHSGSKKGPVVKSRKQAIAIAMSEAGMSKKARRMHNPHAPYGDNAAKAEYGSTPAYRGRGRNILNP